MLPLLAAVAASLAVHVAVLFGPEIEWPPAIAEPEMPLQVELRSAPLAMAVEPATMAAGHKPRLRSTGEKRKKAPPPAVEPPLPLPGDTGKAVVPPVSDSAVAPVSAAEAPASTLLPSSVEMPVAPAAPAPVAPLLPASGYIRYQVSKESLGLAIGWVEQRWLFPGDGSYRLSSRSETSGLASLFRPVRFESESSGRLVAEGLQPTAYRTRKNSRDNGENADFDWSTVTVTLQRDGRSVAMLPGTQDLLSFPFQLAYLVPTEGAGTLGVVTGRNYEAQRLETLGEEWLETPAGRFRCLHLRAQGANLTEVWLALDRERLPVKIRFADKKGESYVQLAHQIGSGDPPPTESNTGTP